MPNNNVEQSKGKQIMEVDNTVNVDFGNFYFNTEKREIITEDFGKEEHSKINQAELLAEKLTDSFKKIMDNENAKEDFLEAGFHLEASRIGTSEGAKARRGSVTNSNMGNHHLLNIPIVYKGPKVKKKRSSKESSALKDDGDPSVSVIDIK
ncbi:hypothetical protein Cni_G09808 [Canna indica]|uniref:Uncharacterized protein n=1 Tax=Canna indica TaxID=4628 RepID=A0AAQ3QA10_9LILI|nr:hypothetical protein Cni_G09808 [Canna indica]